MKEFRYNIIFLEPTKEAPKDLCFLTYSQS
jgi:hypothetical protein